MIEEAPDLKEVSHFHFRQLSALRIAKGNERAPAKALNAVAAASKYGMLFVGIENGFKILKLENILDLDEDKKIKTIEENYYFQNVSSQTPVLLSLSADQKTLAVCVSSNSYIVANMYDIAAFADPDETPTPFLNVSLSTSPAELREFIWNPVVDGIYAYCLSDGSLHVHELSGTTLKIIASVTNATATAACWSPKGKQLVVGKLDGSFSQYKPTLQEVKTIPPPKLDENQLTVTSICWLSTTMFAVLYMPTSGDLSPNLIMVSVPKGSPIVYTNFYDVCLGNASNVDQRYFLHYESAWEVLICASTDSIEVAVLGEPPKWVQWDLKEDGKALLLGKDGATHAIGMDVMYCAQRRIVVDELVSYPPMPVIFFLTDNGLLVPFHTINSSPNSESLVRPSTPIERENERKRTDVVQSINSQSQNAAIPSTCGSASVFKSLSNTLPSAASTQPTAASVVLAGGDTVARDMPFKMWPNNTSGDLPSVGAVQKVSVNEIPQYVSTETSSAQTFLPSKTTPVSGTFFGIQPVAGSLSTLSPEINEMNKLSRGMPLNTMVPPPPPPLTAMGREGSGRPLAVVQRSVPIINCAPECDQANIIINSSQQKLPAASDSYENEMNSGLQPSNQDVYMTAIVEEINNFEKELQGLKQSSNLSINIGTKEEMANLKSFTLNMQDFQKDMAETMQSLNNDIHSLKNVLLENFVMVEEAYHKERRKNDHFYISMLKDIALDPLTAKRMQKIDQHYHYLNTQLLEVNNKLDQDWIEYLEAKKKNRKSVHNISSMEAIYRAIVNNQKTVHNLQNSLDHLSQRLEKKKMENISKRRSVFYSKKSKSGPEELAKLADAFLQTKISNPEEEVPKPSKKISHEAQNLLKKFLSNANVTTVRPAVIYSPSQSRLISKSSLLLKNTFDSKLNESSDNNTNSDIISIPEEVNSFSKEKTEKVIGDASKVTRTSNFSSPMQTLSLSKKLTPKVSPPAPCPLVYEDITPPDSPQSAGYNLGFFSNDDHSPHLASSVSLQNAADMQNHAEFINARVPSIQAVNSLHPSENSAHRSETSVIKSLTEPAQSRDNIEDHSNVPKFSVLSSSVSSMQTTVLQPKNIMTPSAASNTIITTKPSLFSPKPIVSSKSDSSIENALFSSKNTPEFGGFMKPSQKSSFSQSGTSYSITGFHPASVTTTSNAQSELTRTSNEFSQGEPKLSFFPSAFSFKTSENSKPGSVVVTTTTTASTTTTSLLLGSGGKGTSAFSFPTAYVSSIIVSSKDNSKLSSFFKEDFKDSPSGELNKKSESGKDFPSQHSSLSNSEITVQKLSSKSEDGKIPVPSLWKTNSVAVCHASDNPVVTTQSVDSTSTKEPAHTFSGFEFPTSLGEKSNVQAIINQGTVVTSQSSIPSPLLGQTPTAFQETKLDKTIPASSPVTSSVTVPSLEQTVTVSLPKEPDVSEASVIVVTVSSGTATVSTTSSSIFSQINSATPSLFKAPTSTSNNNLFSQVIPTSDAAALTSTTTTTSSSLVQSTTAISTVPQTTSESVFGQTSLPSPPQPSSSSFFTPNTTVPFNASAATTTAPAFGQTGQASFFGQSATTQSSFFGKPSTETSVFGQAVVSQNSSFGASSSVSTTGPFGQGASTFFSQPAGGQPSVFGGGTESNNSGFGSQPAASGFSFGKSTFGQTGGSFGLAKSVFGQNTGSFQQSTSATNSSFGQSPGSSGFGQSSFFSGLGGKPNPENASKNVFGVGNLEKPSTDVNIFGSSGPSTFGQKSGGSFSGGSFSSGGGSVVQSGFGAFQQTPQKTAAFGSPPSFGSAPAFGSAPTFGTPPGFGSSPVGSSVFNNGQQSANFSSFASASSPTFGSLASQSPPAFGNQQPAFGQQSSPFGSGSVFGSSPAFGGQPSSFGSPSSGTGSSSAFTQWRN